MVCRRKKHCAASTRLVTTLDRQNGKMIDQAGEQRIRICADLASLSVRNNR